MISTNTFVAQVAPQRSSQYSNLARDLATAELLASPLGQTLSSVSLENIAGQDYVKFTTSGAGLTEQHHRQLASMAMLGNVFEFFESIDAVQGPLLRPVAVTYPFAISRDLPSIRRYKGKTSEFFTHFVCNIAKNASDFRHMDWRELKLLDPMCGGGTTLFVGLSLGASVAGVELDQDDVESTATFITQYCRENRISLSANQERLRKLGNARRWHFQIGRESPLRCMLVSGSGAAAKELTSGFGRPHLIVADLPYGIQHKAPLQALLTDCLPAWAKLLDPGGCMAFSWDSTRFTREEMVAFVRDTAPFDVMETPPYDSLAHRVDRVIKRRDVIVARIRP
ncbi:hypothetical protein A5906_30010 [Bradyrhizobium sacchari]|uniref:Putative RNA methylase family UPF0020 n=2 Tax=Bradyrhizobium sacchari TaxID=1399419 RepID=A0A560JRY9_9BRAD|nr:hypothetical protein A5906_30010 [Bradyrhizobium sacchari]TWB60277.1 putative RNA methylase family UPF0020 [Bradyrhizobium sacchari]TWB73913.1 putative RNA methylase family UPF0020 [Bradyrhizobium sacchari]